MLLERERIEADPYGQFVSPRSDEAPIATAATDKLATTTDTRAQGPAANHKRNASYSHARSKRPGPPPIRTTISPTHTRTRTRTQRAPQQRQRRQQHLFPVRLGIRNACCGTYVSPEPPQPSSRYWHWERFGRAEKIVASAPYAGGKVGTFPKCTTFRTCVHQRQEPYAWGL
ncbi:hypothetical protein BJV77DRAFT_1002912, partial [Russula vinacea]